MVIEEQVPETTVEEIVEAVLVDTEEEEASTDTTLALALGIGLTCLVIGVLVYLKDHKNAKEARRMKTADPSGDLTSVVTTDDFAQQALATRPAGGITADLSGSGDLSGVSGSGLSSQLSLRSGGGISGDLTGGVGAASHAKQPSAELVRQGTSAKL